MEEQYCPVCDRGIGFWSAPDESPCSCKHRIPNLQVVGLAGNVGAGKDYVYQQCLRPRGFLQISLAWHFKIDLIGKGVVTFEEAFITKPPKVRTIMQMFGTELGRNVYGDKVWCNTLVAWLNTYYHHWGVTTFAIPDVRFKSELDFVQHDLDGKVLRVDAPNRISKTNLDSGHRAHQSEAELATIPVERFDGLIFNDENDPDLDLQMLELFQSFGWNYSAS